MSENHDWRTKATMDSATRAVDAVLRPGPANGHAAIQESDDSDAAFMVGLWDGLDDLREMPGYPDLLGTPTWRERLVQMRAHLAAVAKPIAWFTLPAGAAATLAFYALAPSPSYYATTGATQRVTLADRSVVTLDPSSTLRFEVRDGRRLATLVGRARFDIAHDKAHPFLIAVGDAQVQVVGTQFTLDYRQPCTQLSVISGIVTLRSPSTAPRRLNAGEEAVSVDRGKAYRTCLSGAKNAANLRWSYIDVPLSTIIRDVQPYYPSRIVLSSPELAAEHVTTSFRMADVANLMESLPAMIEADVKRGPDGAIHIKPKSGRRAVNPASRIPA